MVRPATVLPSEGALLTREALVVSPRRFIAIWWLVQGLHAVFITYSINVIRLHRYFITQDLQSTINYLGPAVYGFFDAVIAAHSVLIVCHATAMLLSVWWSLYYRQWLFVSHSTDKPRRNRPQRQAVITPTFLVKTTATASSATPNSTVQSSEIVVARTLLHRSIQAFKKAGLALFGRHGFFGVEGVYYENTFFAMEVVEIALQIFQAYKLSTLVPRIWINRLNAVVLILNCWSTVIVHHFLRSDRLTKRVVLLVVDGIFDIVSSMVIPLVIIYPYYEEFDASTGDFPLVNYYYDKWFIQAVSENRQVFVTSWLDYISKLTPCIAVLCGMLVLKQYVVMNRAMTGSHLNALHGHSASGSRRSGIPIVSQASVPSPNPSVQIREAKSTVNTPEEADDDDTSTQFTRGQWLQTNYQHLILFLAGLAILILHIHSTTVAVLSQTRGCLLEVRPWFATSYTCIALEINCAHGEFDDGADVAALEEQGRAVLPSALRSLIFASCARLHVPPMIQSFSGLQMIKIYNSTVVQWDDTKAELRDDLHFDMQLLYVSDSNFSDDGAIPVGVLSANFPPTLTDIEFSGTNIQRFPPDLHTKWTTILYFVLERCPHITQIPEPLGKMKIQHLFLAGNDITTLPQDLLVDQLFWRLSLNGNPLQALPDTIGDLSSLNVVEVAHTNVSALPSWLTSVQYHPTTGEPMVPFRGDATVVAGGSPLCEDAEARETATRDKLPWVLLDCSPLWTDYLYPIDEEREWRAASLANLG